MAPKTPHPDLIVADTMNNRIQYIPDDSSQPPLCFGTSGENLGQFKGPEDVAYHDNYSDWDYEKGQDCRCGDASREAK